MGSATGKAFGKLGDKPPSRGEVAQRYGALRLPLVRKCLEEQVNRIRDEYKESEAFPHPAVYAYGEIDGELELFVSKAVEWETYLEMKERAKVRVDAELAAFERTYSIYFDTAQDRSLIASIEKLMDGQERLQGIHDSPELARLEQSTANWAEDAADVFREGIHAHLNSAALFHREIADHLVAALGAEASLLKVARQAWFDIPGLYHASVPADSHGTSGALSLASLGVGILALAVPGVGLAAAVSVASLGLGAASYLVSLEEECGIEIEVVDLPDATFDTILAEIRTAVYKVATSVSENRIALAGELDQALEAKRSLLDSSEEVLVPGVHVFGPDPDSQPQPDPSEGGNVAV